MSKSKVGTKYIKIRLNQNGYLKTKPFNHLNQI